MLAKYIIIILSFAFLLSGCSGFQSYTKISKEEHTISSNKIKTLILDNISGGIRISRSNDSLIKIKVTKQINVKKKELEKTFTEIVVNIDSTESELLIDSDIIAKSGGLFSKAKNPIVDYEISLPNFMNLKIDNVNGPVVINNINGNIDVDIVNGSIEFNGSAEDINFGVTNGDITGKLDSVNSIHIACINTEILLTLPKELPGSFNIESTNGKIETDNLILSETKEDKNSLSGKIGNATIPIKIKTVNGKIFLIGK
ncbi:MAG TPA: hypothetical protein PLG90_02770 [Ignavibacteria bacterium]|nr:hypothetical protein [Ignavibacteria bacterium]